MSDVLTDDDVGNGEDDAGADHGLGKHWHFEVCVSVRLYSLNKSYILTQIDCIDYTIGLLELGFWWLTYCRVVDQ